MPVVQGVYLLSFFYAYVRGQTGLLMPLGESAEKSCEKCGTFQRKPPMFLMQSAVLFLPVFRCRFPSSHHRQDRTSKVRRLRICQPLQKLHHFVVFLKTPRCNFAGETNTLRQ